jgi:hypothetical protein
MNSLIGIFEKSPKGDSYRPTVAPDQYNDGIAALNSLGDSQYQKINTQTINRVSKNKSVLGSNTNSGNTILPGSN